MKIINVFKTHFDIGFTELAADVIKRYGGKMLDSVIEMCEKTANREKGKKYVWTMAAWPMLKSLENCEPEKKVRAEKLIDSGQLTIHALPFTTHTEFMCEQDMEHLFDCAKTFCDRYKVDFPKSAKMTDVPGHSIALVKYLARNGVKFLHLGCNPASTYPKVPTMFWWQDKYGNRVLTFYNKTYGSSIVPPKGWKYPVWLSMQQSNDNVGPQDSSVLDKIESDTKISYPDAEVVFGTMDDFYNEIIKCDLSDLPVITTDLGDTWIHGVATYPKEVSMLRRARKTVEGVKMEKNDEEEFYENSILFSEHTWGMDVKTHLTWQRSYDKQSFLAERDSVRYKLVEESWNEQRRRAEICAKIAEKYKREEKTIESRTQTERLKLYVKDNRLHILNKLTERVIVIDYKYGIVGTQKITDFQKKYLTRLYEWAIADFGRQSYGEVEEKTFKLKDCKSYEQDGYVCVEYTVPRESVEKYGNAEKVIIKAGIVDEKVKVYVTLKNKGATPFVEYGDLYLKTNAKGEKFIVKKIGYELDVMKDIAENANNIMYCVSDCVKIDDVKINPIDSPLVSFGTGAIFKFNGGKAKKRKPNFVFNLFNNMWGTNFPQWIEGTFNFEYEIEL